TGSPVSVLRNQTTLNAAVPSFAPAVDFVADARPQAIAASDINGDGRPDLILSNASGNSIAVMLNATPAGPFAQAFPTQQALPVGAPTGAVAVRDLNGDGKPDIVLT